MRNKKVELVLYDGPPSRQHTHSIWPPLLVNMAWKCEFDLTFRLPASSTSSRSAAARRPDVSLSPSLFISFLISFDCRRLARLLLAFFHSAGAAGWGGSGCDPITGRLQQSPSADWFYNPHSRSQAARKSGGREEEPRSRSRVRMHAKNYITLSILLFHAFISCRENSAGMCMCVCECAKGGSVIEQQKGE